MNGKRIAESIGALKLVEHRCQSLDEAEPSIVDNGSIIATGRPKSISRSTSRAERISRMSQDVSLLGSIMFLDEQSLPKTELMSSPQILVKELTERPHVVGG